MNKPDVLRVTRDQNPAVAEAMEQGQVQVGEKVKFEVIATLKNFDEEGYDFTIEAVIPEDYEVAEDSEEVPRPMATTERDPIMSETASLVRRKA